MQPSDTRLLQQAEGYLELELPGEAIKMLFLIGGEARASFEWNFLAAEANRALGRFEQALPFFEQAKTLRPKVIAVYLQLGWCYKRTGEITRAIDALIEAEELCRQAPDIDNHSLVMYNLSCYFCLAGRKPETLHWLTKALKADPDFRKMIPQETDFDRYRNDPDFCRVVGPVESTKADEIQ